MTELDIYKSVFWSEFWPGFISTVLGIILTGLISLFTILWQVKRQQVSIYLSTIKTLLSEVKDNNRVITSGEKFTLNLFNIEHKLLMTQFGHVVLDGALSSERLNNFFNDELTNELVLFNRKIKLHNFTEGLLTEGLADTKDEKRSYLEWMIENLNTKQELLLVDFETVIRLLEREIFKYEKNEKHTKLKENFKKCFKMLFE